MLWKWIVTVVGVDRVGISLGLVQYLLITGVKYYVY